MIPKNGPLPLHHEDKQRLRSAVFSLGPGLPESSSLVHQQLACAGNPLLVEVPEDRSSESQQRRIGGERSDDPGSPFQIPVYSFHFNGLPDPFPMRHREGCVDSGVPKETVLLSVPPSDILVAQGHRHTPGVSLRCRMRPAAGPRSLSRVLLRDVSQHCSGRMHLAHCQEAPTMVVMTAVWIPR